MTTQTHQVKKLLPVARKTRVYKSVYIKPRAVTLRLLSSQLNIHVRFSVSFQTARGVYACLCHQQIHECPGTHWTRRRLFVQHSRCYFTELFLKRIEMCHKQVTVGTSITPFSYKNNRIIMLLRFHCQSID